MILRCDLGMGLSYMPLDYGMSLNSLRQQQHLVTQTAALNNLFRRIFAAVAVVIAALLISSAKTTVSITRLKYSSNILSFHTGKIFVCCAILYTFTLPFAWQRFSEQYRIDQLKKLGLIKMLGQLHRFYQIHM